MLFILLIAMLAAIWAIIAESKSRNLQRKIREVSADLQIYKQKSQKMEILIVKQRNERSFNSEKPEAIDALNPAPVASQRANDISTREKEDLLQKLCLAREERNAIQKKLDDSNLIADQISSQLKKANQDLIIAAEKLNLAQNKNHYLIESERKAREELADEMRARKTAVQAYMELESQLFEDKQSAISSRIFSGLNEPTNLAIDITKKTSTVFPDIGFNFVLLDVETTGLSNEDEIVEIAMLEVDLHGKIKNTLETTIRASRNSSKQALEKHGLTPNDLMHSPAFENVSHAIANFIDGKILIAHNLAFDKRLLQNAFNKVNELSVNLGNGIDTINGSNKAGKVSLEKLCKELDLDYEAHTAMGDISALLTLIERGHIQVPVSGRESCASVAGLIRPGDCELRPRSLIKNGVSLQSPSVLPGNTSIASNEFKEAGTITLQPGDKVCCSCNSRFSQLRDLLYSKHAELGLVSPRSISSAHKCIVVEDLSSGSGKAASAAALGKPFALADDFLKYASGQPLRVWNRK